MKFTVNTDALKQATGNILTLFASGMGIQDLTCMLSSTSKKELLVECSAGGAYFSRRLPAKVEKEGKMAISVYYLDNLSFPSDEVSMEVHKNTLSFSCGRLKGKFDTLSEGDPVERIKFKEETAISLDADLFSKLVDAILFAPTVQDNSNVLRFKANKDKRTLSVVTADTYRAARYHTKSAKSMSVFKVKPVSGDKKKPNGKGKKEKDTAALKESMRTAKNSVYVSGDFDYVFPSGLLISIKNLFEGRLDLAANDKVIRLKDEFLTIIHPSQEKDVGAKLEDFIKGLEGTKPVVEAVIDPGEANSIIYSASSISNNKEGQIILAPDGNKFLVKVRADHAETKASFDAKIHKAKKGKDFKVGFVYLSEFLSLVDVFAGGKARLRVWDNALMLEADEKATYIMPILGD